ncbi:MAG: response regulator [Sandaracinus sp.]
MTSAAGTILIADDSDEMRELVRTWLARKRRDVTLITARNGHEVLAMIETLFSAGPEQAGPVLVITDYRMPGLDGLSLLDSLARSPFDVACIVMTGFGDPLVHESFATHGALASFDKPVDLDRLTEVAWSALESQAAHTHAR